MANGNGWMLKTAIGFGITAIVGAQTFSGNAIYKNREKNIEEHTSIVEKMIERDDRFTDALHKLDVRQEVLISEVKGIAAKL